MKIFLKKILYLLEFLPKMPDDVFQLKLFRNHMRKVIFNRDNLYFLDNCNNNNTINVQENNKPNIMVITHDFSNTGAPKVTLDLCKKLKEIYDANIYIVGPSNGDLINMVMYFIYLIYHLKKKILLNFAINLT